MGLVEKDPLVHSLGPLTEIDDWKAFRSSEPAWIEQLRLHTRTGRPLGGESFVKRIGDLIETLPPEQLNQLIEGLSEIIG